MIASSRSRTTQGSDSFLTCSTDGTGGISRIVPTERSYSHRFWGSQNGFLAKTSSKDYRKRLFYFVFAMLLHNIWRLTDFLLKAAVDGPMDYAPGVDCR
jgi:hypothetical protein